MPAFARVVVLRNPVSTHAAQGERRIAELRRLHGDVTVLDTSPKGPEANRALLCSQAQLLGPATLLAVAGGDGTLGLVIETLLKDPRLPARARKTPILPLWAGNANDLAHMLNGPSYRTRLKDVLQNGRVVAVHPLACRLQSRTGERDTRIAACYLSFGGSAFATVKLNERQSRDHPLRRAPATRFISELIAGGRAYRNAAPFTVTEHGQTKTVYERMIANGSRFAKVEGMPLKLTDKAFYLHTMDDTRLAASLSRAVALTQKRFAAKFTRQRAEFVVEQSTVAQFDGEATDIPAGTKVTIAPHTRPFYALSTLLHG